ncbi:hypothetical protein [Propionivibrio sp.]|uniref:hypothetical protein n=1 Tax=Propionivibrio sp. TaxID=2212460 RepID=UPI0025E00FD0|nr:hypothetical protein [Propionivibrio sp.]
MVDATLTVTQAVRLLIYRNYQEVLEMKLGKTIGAALFMSALLIALSGCQKQEGPAEKAGKEMDKTVEKVGSRLKRPVTPFRTQPRAKRNRLSQTRATVSSE